MGASWAQTRPIPKGKPAVKNLADAELNQRIRAGDAARTAGDPIKVAEADRKLTALALREMGQLRLLELAYPQAIDLYRQSLVFEDSAGTRVDLAISQMDAGQVDEAIIEAKTVLSTDPTNVRANTVLGRALMHKGEYADASVALATAAQAEPSIESLYTLAICLLDTKSQKAKERAGEVFQQMIAMAGDNSSLHVLFGRAYRDADDLTNAVAELQKAIALDPKTPHAHYFLGLAKLSLNEWKPTPEVTAEFKKEVENYPHDFLANYMLGFIASEQRQYQESDQWLKKAAEIDPAWPEPWLYMGLNAYAQDDKQGAEVALRKAVELTGKDEARSNYQIRRAYVDLGRILSASGRKDEAEVFLAKARDLQNKTMAQTQQSVARSAAANGAGDAAALVAVNHDLEAQSAPLLPQESDPFARVDASALERAKLTPAEQASAEAQEERLRRVLGASLNDLATSEAMLKDYATALTHFEQAEQWNAKTPGIAKNLGVCAFKAENYAEAVRGLSAALREKPQDLPVRAMLGVSYFASDKYGDAVKTFEPLGERGMQDPTVGYAWAAALAKTGDTRQAAIVLQKFESVGTLPAETQLLVGQLWTEIGNYQKAVETFHRALQENPSLPKAHSYAGLAQLRAENWPESAREFEAELALVPGDLDAKYNLGFVELQQGKSVEAEKLFDEVITAEPNYANAQYQLGKLLLDRGKVKEAIGHLEIAANVMPQVDYVHYQLQSAYRKDSRTADADRELEIYKKLKAREREQSALPKQTP